MVQKIRTEQVTHRAVAEALLDERRRTVLAAFLRPTTVSAAARHLNRPLNTVKYHLQKLLHLGLLRLAAVAEGQEAGPTKYVACATHFFVPYALTSAHWPQEMLELVHQDWERQLQAALLHSAQQEVEKRGLWGVQIVQSGASLTLEHAVWSAGWNFTHPDAPAVLDMFDTLSLDYADAKAFQQELLQLVSRYRRKGGAQAHLLRLTLTPQVES